MRGKNVVPILESERLILRGHALDDFHSSLALWSDPIVTRYIGGKPTTETEMWTRLLRYVGHWQLLDFGYWVVTEKSGRFVGEVGFADFKRAITPALDAPEMGWAFIAEVHGRGYATEAVRAAQAWGDAHLPKRTVCLISPDNAPSLRVADRCGFREYARTTFAGAPTILCERWQRAAAHSCRSGAMSPATLSIVAICPVASPSACARSAMRLGK